MTGNPDPQLIRQWHIPNPYPSQGPGAPGVCDYCQQSIGPGDLINIEYEAGPVCYDENCR